MPFRRISTRRALGILLALCGTAAPVGAQAPAQDHSGQYSPAEIAIGARVYGANCSVCHATSGTGVGTVDLRRGPLPRAATDEALRALLAAGLPGSGMPAFRFEPAELAGLIAFIRSGFAAAPPEPPAGDPARGQVIFETTGECLTCHRVNDRGRFSGPDLTEIGRIRQPQALMRTLADPTGSMQPINRPVRAVTREGAVITGRRLNEDLFTVQLVTDEGRLVSLVKPELREWTVGTTSPMPSMTQRLSPAELSDLLAYLASLKGARP
jgi:putative heme-binding domain-containing protein